MYYIVDCLQIVRLIHNDCRLKSRSISIAIAFVRVISTAWLSTITTSVTRSKQTNRATWAIQELKKIFGMATTNRLTDYSVGTIIIGYKISNRLVVSNKTMYVFNAFSKYFLFFKTII